MTICNTVETIKNARVPAVRSFAFIHPSYDLGYGDDGGGVLYAPDMDQSPDYWAVFGWLYSAQRWSTIAEVPFRAQAARIARTYNRLAGEKLYGDMHDTMSWIDLADAAECGELV